MSALFENSAASPKSQSNSTARKLTGRKLSLACAVASLALATIGDAAACPRIGPDRFVDFNCDGRYRVSFTGDSIVRGVGDELNDDKGGYVKRLNELHGNGRVKFLNLGIPGITTGRLLRDLKRNLNNKRAPVAQRKTSDVDLVIVDVGRNDFFDRNPVSFTIRNIRRIVKTLRREIEKRGAKPFVIVSTLIPTRRGFQQPFIDEINEDLLRFKSNSLPTFLRFDSLPTRFISDDDLHPSSEGFDKLSQMVSRFLSKKANKLLLSRRRDSDGDAIFDEAERRMGLSAAHADTDGDSFADGLELFVLETNPLDPSEPAAGF